jgi:hypothetical protein
MSKIVTVQVFYLATVSIEKQDLRNVEVKIESQAFFLDLL